MGHIIDSTTDDTPATTHYVVWHRRNGGPVSPPFATREAARAHLVEAYGGRPGLEVRRVVLDEGPDLLCDHCAPHADEAFTAGLRAGRRLERGTR